MPRQMKKREYATARKSKPTANVQNAKIDKLTLDLPLDEEKVAAIQRCLAKGKLTITVSDIDLGTGRLRAAWRAYD